MNSKGEWSKILKLTRNQTTRNGISVKVNPSKKNKKKSPNRKLTLLHQFDMNTKKKTKQAEEGKTEV